MATKPLPAPLDIDEPLKAALAGTLKNRIHMIGVELEGGWTHRENYPGLIHDGSVVVNAPAECFTTNRFGERTASNVSFYAGELPSPPLPPSQMWPWLEANWPHVSNDTCGMHVHMSFKMAGHYQRLISPALTSTIVAQMTKWATAQDLPQAHPIWGRLAGRSRYCSHEYFGEQQLAQTRKNYGMNQEGHRYTVMNYCFRVNETMECRLLPMFETAAQGIAAIQHLLAVTNASLAVLSKVRETPVRVQIVDAEGPTRVEQHAEFV